MSRLPTIHYCSVSLDCSAPSGDDEGELTFSEGEAVIVDAEAGFSLEGYLLDCPDLGPEVGCVVIQTRDGPLAAISGRFRDLMIENSPCLLRLDPIWVQKSLGSPYRDWDAYELGPNGTCILVSDDSP
jgi:hypothetical protein